MTMHDGLRTGSLWHAIHVARLHPERQGVSCTDCGAFYPQTRFPELTTGCPNCQRKT